MVCVHLRVRGVATIQAHVTWMIGGGDLTVRLCTLKTKGMGFERMNLEEQPWVREKQSRSPSAYNHPWALEESGPGLSSWERTTVIGTCTGANRKHKSWAMFLPCRHNTWLSPSEEGDSSFSAELLVNLTMDLKGQSPMLWAWRENQMYHTF